MTTRLVNVVVDAGNPSALARFWSAAIGRPVVISNPHEVGLALSVSPPIWLVFVPVPEPKTVKNRIHLDLATYPPAQQRELVERLKGLGARPADVGQKDVPWVVLGDPEGNELCVLEPRETHGYSGPVASIVVDAVEPPRMASFWSAATGWPVVRTERWGTLLRAASGDGPYLELVGCSDEKIGKNRVHLDVARLVSCSARGPCSVERAAEPGASHGQGQLRDR